MILLRLLFKLNIILITFYSCASKKKEIQPLHTDDRLPFLVIEPETIKYYPVSIIGLYFLTNEKDTLYPTELYFSDSLRFTQAFKDFKVSEICIAANWQGKTFYSVQVNDTGGFQDFKVVKEVSKEFRSYDEQVKKKLYQSKLIDSTYFNRELIFFHKFILR